MKAFLYHLQKHYTEALRSLQEAAVIIKDQCQVLVIYGNYAWIYYHLANYSKVEKYLHKIRGICQSLGSPHPYSIMTPEILAQKGWSFLASGFQNGEEAIACFQKALRELPTNQEFKAGLATAFYASWERAGIVCRWDKSKELLEELVSVQPQNWELKMYLASLLLHQDKERVKGLLEEVVHNSRSPDILRKVAHLCVCVQPRQLTPAISALKMAIRLDSSYRLLYYDLGLCYKLQMEGASPDDRAIALESATNCFLLAVEMGSLFIDPRLELAKIYGERGPDHEEAVYLHLMQELPNVSMRCKQAIYLHWGDFLLQKKGLKHQALEMYKTGVKISGGHFTERDQLERRLMDLMKIFQEDSELDCVDTIYSLFQTTGYQGPDTHQSCPWWHNHRVWS
ncbi:interferon-induced protein with tetratricopeptide repeats 5-like [Sceloporus undulatus]|uniref:interferon-induced protein with tetratricopeptide repeats 5-like n=1 Tax=Sceloporus undulatus TaxID=8520 RepID=UPI001C4C27DA|nr:interferon-induced protein with tetratricopeptide repeats 5-like [Sceloporus undulatus]